MSFKRDGNDDSWLRSLQKRRVSELLSEDIPDGEAILMRNGKFACMICNHRPVFDTVNMLSIHRNGRKHQDSVYHKEMQQAELEQLRRTRLHEEYLKNGEIDKETMGMGGSSHGTTKSAPLLGSRPYDPRAKRRPDKRRQVIDLDSDRDTPSNVDVHSLSSFDTSRSSEAPPQTIAKYKKMVRLKSEQKLMQLKPYERRTTSTNVNSEHMMQTSRNSSLTSKCRANSNYDSYTSHSLPAPAPLHDSSQKCDSPTSPISFVPGLLHGNSETHQTRNLSLEKKNEKAKFREKYLQATSAGWKKDRSGTWVKDEAVEFDSDEEPPDIP